MALHFEDKWVWDFWFARDGADIHIFYLQAPRSLGNPDLRHWHSTIGHAVSRDLIHWEILMDALEPSGDAEAWDSLTTWTGSIIKHEGSWYMFYTGTNKKEDGLIQRIGLATSENLLDWHKYDLNPVIKIDPRWYELLDINLWYEQAWRDPWIFEHEGTFHAMITARSKIGRPKARGLIGYACSNDLLHWDIRSPLTQPGEFAYLEVPQLVEINNRWYLLFCVEGSKYSDTRRRRSGVQMKTGTHYMFADDPLGPFIQPEKDLLFGDKEGSSYSGKIILDNAGEWMFMTAVQYNSSGDYAGDISDPMPIYINDEGEFSIIGFKPKID